MYRITPVKQSIIWNSEFHKITNELFRNDSFRSNIAFDLSKKEAGFIKRNLTNVEIGPDTLLNHWSSLNVGQIEPINGLLDIPQTGNSKLDIVVEESKKYSCLAQGINYAYRFALCDHRANEVYKNHLDNKSEWNSYAKNNIENLGYWMAKNKDLKKWDLMELKNAIEQYKPTDKIDDALKKMFYTFQDVWKVSRSAKQLAVRFAKEAKEQEYHRRRNRSHFIDWQVSIPDNAKGLREWSNIMFNFRFKQGKGNALDLIRGLRRAR